MRYKFLIFILIISSSAISQNIKEIILKNDSLKIELIDSINDVSINLLHTAPIKGLKTAKRANKLAREIKYKRGIAISLNYMGRLYYEMSEYQLAQETQLEALEIHKEIEFSKGICISLETLGTIHNAINQDKEAIEYYKKSIEKSKEINFQKGIATSLGNIAIIYKEQKKYEEALVYYNKSLLIFKKENEKYNIARTLHNMGCLYYKLEDYDEGLLIQKEALKLFTEIDNEFGTIATNNAIGRLYIASKNYKQSEKYLLKALKQSKTLEHYSKDVHLYFCLYKLYEAKGDYKKALKYHVLQKEAHDKGISKKSIQQINFTKAKHESELEHKNYEILKTKQKLHNREIIAQKYSIYITIAFSILLLILCVIIYSKYRFKNKANILLHQQKRQLAAAVKIQNKLNKEKDGFMSILSHDLRNPFNVILGLINSLEMYYYELDNEERTEYISNISKAANNAFMLLEDILTWSRAQSKGLKINPKELNVHELFTSSSEILQAVAKNKNINIEMRVNKDDIINVDKFTISTVINNLISNSIKFTPEGGLITLSYKRTEQYVELKIKDTGIGMSKESIDKLFQIGKNVSTRGTNNEKGTGLGLLICDEFVRLNNGEIMVESNKGEGTCFAIRIFES